MTDLPLAPTKPIDFGGYRFCHSCRKCAESCPSNALKTDDEPSWDVTPATGDVKPELFNNPGIKTWYFDHFKCNKYWKETDTYCGICQGICVFSKEGDASIHDVVKAMISSTSMFNGFFYNMDEFFGYGVAPEERATDWWDTCLPVNGIDYSDDVFYK
jgi:reductive dehalogenase